MIPRNVIQTFPTASLPPRLSAVRDEMIDLNPSWTFLLFDDESIEAFITKHYGAETIRLYRSIAPEYGAARADFFRYLAVYQMGGIYLDIKSACSVPFDTVLQPDEAFVLSQWRNKPGEIHAGFGLHRDLSDLPGGEFQQWFIISQQRHPFLAAVIERVSSNIKAYSPWTFGTGRRGVQRLTGPIAYSKAIAPLLSSAEHRRIDNEEDIHFHYSPRENYDHQKIFSSHYSRHQTPVVAGGSGSVASNWLYQRALRLRQMIGGEGGA